MLFGSLSRDIQLALRQGGSDPAANAALREAIERARRANVPQANIDRLLRKDMSTFTPVTYEGFGPGGVGLLMLTSTDNPNRTVAALRALLKEHGGSLGEPNSVRWKFVPVISFTATLPVVEFETLELTLIDAGVIELELHNTTLMVVTSPETASAVADVLQQAGARDVARRPDYFVAPEHRITLSAPQTAAWQELMTVLGEQPDVDMIYTDAKP